MITNNTTVYTIIPEKSNGDLIGDYTREELVRASWCYLHGELDFEVGYDIFSMLKSELKPEQFDEHGRLTDEFESGIYSCICMGEPCTFFRWKNSECHGLVVLNTDKDAYEYAFKSYREKKSSF